MARTRRRAWALTIAAAMLAVVWVVSMRFYPSYSGRRWSAAFYRGGIGLVTRSDYLLGDDDGFEWYDSGDWVSLWWFSYEDKKTSPVSDLSIWQIPLWPFILLTGVPGVWMLAKSRRGKGDAGANLCPSCGYDLTGLPPTKRGPVACPECGKTA